MPKYVFSRTHTHRSIHGHTIGFIKGEPTWVPPGPIELEVAGIGAERVDGEQPNLVPSAPTAKVELSAEDLEQLMREAFKELIDKNEAADFTAAGVPTVKAMEKIVGENLTARDIAELWAKVKEEGAQ